MFCIQIASGWSSSSGAYPASMHICTCVHMPLLKICFCLLRHAAITFHSKSANHAVARPTDLWQLEAGILSMLGSLVVQTVTNWCLASSQSAGRKTQDRPMLGISDYSSTGGLPAMEACTLPALGEPCLSFPNKLRCQF